MWLLWNDRVLPLAEGENVIGRDPSCGVWLDQPGVSRHHARVLVTEDVAESRIWEARRAVVANAIAGPHQLRDADIIRSGPSIEVRRWPRRSRWQPRYSESE